MNPLCRKSRDFEILAHPLGKRWILAVFVVSTILFCPGRGSAHYIMLKRADDPADWQNNLSLFPPRSITMFTEETATIIVEDGGGCNAWIWATVKGEPLIMLHPAGKEQEQYGVLVEIEVVAGSQAGVTVILIEWEGQHTRGEEGSCLEVEAIPVIINVIEKPEAITASNMEHNAPAGDPVDMYTGEFYFHEEPDLDLGGPMPLYFQRYYSSKMRQAHIVGDLGDNWRHNFEWRVHWNGNHLVLVTASGKVLRYLKTGGEWALLSNTENHYQLVQEYSTIKVGDARNNRVYHFSPEGRLAEISDGKGNRHLLTYANGKLAEVRDVASGQTLRWLVFGYDNDTGKLHSVLEQYSGGVGRGVGFFYEGDNLTEVKDRGNNYTQYVYDIDHADPGLLRFRSTPEGKTPWFQKYNDLGKVEEQRDIYGNTFSFLYEPPLKPATTTITDPYGRKTIYHFDQDDSGSLVGVTDPLGRRIEIGVNDQRLRNEIVTRGGAVFQREYDPATGATVRAVDENGNETRFTYTQRTAPEGFSFRDLTRIDYADGTFASFAHDSSGNVISSTGPAGHSWTYTYNPFGQILTAANPRGAVTTFTYNSLRDLASMTDAAGNLTRFYYNATNRVNRIELGDPSTIRAFWYDAYDRLVQARNERGALTDLAYDLDGLLVGATDAMGNLTTFEYDGLNRLLEVSYPEGNPLSLTYEKFGRVATVTAPNGNIFSYAYDDVGRLTAVADSLGTIWEQTVNADGWTTDVTDSLANTASFTRDPGGRLVAAFSPEGRSAQIGYDKMSRPISSSSGGLTNHLVRDPRGFVTEAILPGGLVRAHYQRDELSNLTKVIDPLGNSWIRTYDGQGRLVSTIDPLGNVTSYSRDNRNRVIRMELPLSNVTLTRDAGGNITGRLYSDGTTLTYSYDRNNRLIGGNALSLAYDGNSRINRIHGFSIEFRAALPALTQAFRRMIMLRHNLAVRIYDADGQVTTKPVSHVEGKEEEKPALNALLAEIWPDSTSPDPGLTSEERRKLIRALAAIFDHENPDGIAVNRDAAGRISRVEFTPGNFVDYTYNVRDQVTRVTDWLENQTDFSYDAAGRLAEMLRPNGVATFYTYDSDGLLISVQEKQGAATLAATLLKRDQHGQIRSAVRSYPPGTPRLSLAPSDERATYNEASQASGYLYDAMGRRLADGDHDYEWDLASRLTSYSRKGQTVTFAYDALGQLIARASGGVMRDFVWNYAFGRPVISIVREDGSSVRYDVHTPAGLLLYSIDAGTEAARHYHFDEMGNTVMLTDSLGDVVTTYRYSPYGELLTDSSNGTVENPFTYRGRWGIVGEGESGLYYKRARWYDAANGRFLSRDPIKLLDPRMINPYQHAALNPMLYIDPTGQKPERPELITTKGWENNNEVNVTERDPAMQAAILLFGADPVHSGFSPPMEASPLTMDSHLMTYEEWPIVSVLNDISPGIMLGTGQMVYPSFGTFPALPFAVPPRQPKPPTIIGHGPGGSPPAVHPRYNLGLYEGWSWTIPWLDESHSTFGIGHTPIFGLPGSFWPTPSLGLRFAGPYLPEPLDD